MTQHDNQIAEIGFDFLTWNIIKFNVKTEIQNGLNLPQNGIVSSGVFFIAGIAILPTLITTQVVQKGPMLRPRPSLWLPKWVSTPIGLQNLSRKF